MLIKIKQDTSIACDVSTIRVFSSMHLIKYYVNIYIHTDHLHIHKINTYIKILIFFLGWQGHNQDGGGTEMSQRGGRFTDHQP